jgi:hypothetical protein
MFSVITNKYNQKAKGPTLMELFTATRKLFFIQLEMFDVCGKNLNIVSMCGVSPVVHILNISSCKKKISFPVAVNNSIKVGILAFLL